MPGSKTAASFFGALTPEPRPFADLINGLYADGLFSKLDRLWIFARPTEAEALTDLTRGAKATNNNSTTFTANVGFTGDGISMEIDSNFDPFSAVNPHFTQDSACLFGWNNTAGDAVWPLVAIGGNGQTRTEISPDHGGDFYWGVSGTNLLGPIATTGPKGLWLASRTASNASTLDFNGSQIDSSADVSRAPDSGDFFALRGGNVHSTRQVCCLGFGEGLSAANRVNLNTRIRNYMGAVGVI